VPRAFPPLPLKISSNGFDDEYIIWLGIGIRVFNHLIISMYIIPVRFFQTHQCYLRKSFLASNGCSWKRWKTGVRSFYASPLFSHPNCVHVYTMYPLLLYYNLQSMRTDEAFVNIPSDKYCNHYKSCSLFFVVNGLM